jgi:hypothetical protein
MSETSDCASNPGLMSRSGGVTRETHLSLLSGLNTMALQQAAAPIVDLTDKSILQSLVDRLVNLPDFLVHPVRSFDQLFAAGADLKEAILFAAAMVFAGVAVSYVLNAARKIELSSVVYSYVGSVVLWMLYGLFLHVFVWLAGGHGGVRTTVAAYLYAMAILQPILPLVFFALGRVLQPKVERRSVWLTWTFGGSGAASGVYVGKKKFLTANVGVWFRLMSGVLILTYFAIAVACAHQMPLWRGALAALMSFVFFLVAFGAAALVVKVVPAPGLKRLVEGW